MSPLDFTIDQPPKATGPRPPDAALDRGEKTQRKSLSVLLVVEDDPDHRNIIREILEDEGYQIATASHGGEALHYLLHGPRPDLILLDLVMPEMDGWAFVSELRKSPTLADILVVVITQGGNRVLSSAPVSAGYLSKPLDRRKLLETIENCLWRNGRGQ